MLAVGLSVPAQSLQTENDKTESETIIMGPKSSWDKTTYDFGDIKYKEPQTAEFILTNDGNEPLIITYAKASCGCTNLKYSHEPILPGKSITISVTYNARGKGNFRKTVTIKTNANDNPQILQIKGKVIME